MNIDGFLGIHNTVSGRDIPDNALTDAIDSDLTDSGGVLSRRGYVLTSDASYQSAYSTQNQRGYGVSGGVLGEIKADGSFIPILSSTASDFDEFGNILFTNDGLVIENNSAISLTLETPIDPPTVTVVNGNYAKGTYSVIYTYVRLSDGLEGGSSPVTQVDINDGEGFTVDVDSVPIGYKAIIYVTDTDDDIYYDSNARAISNENILADPFIVCDKVAFYQSSLYCAKQIDDNRILVRFSAPFRYHLYDDVNRYFIVPGIITGMMGVTDGVIITTTDNVYLYNGALQNLANYGTPHGSPIARAPNGQAFIYTDRGICSYPGDFSLTEKVVSLPSGSHCSVSFVSQRGIQQVVSLHNDGTAFNSFT